MRLVVDIARTLDEVLEAWRLVYNAYLRAGYVPPNPSRLHLSRPAIGPHSLVILGRDEGNLVNTMTAIGDGPFGLPLDSTFPDELAALHTPGRHVFEFGLLAQTTGSFDALSDLMRYAYYFALYQGGTDCVCGIPPERTRLYRRAFGFRPIGEPQGRTRMVDNPVQLLHTSAEYAREYFPQHRALSYILQNPLPQSAFTGRFMFELADIEGSPLQPAPEVGA